MTDSHEATESAIPQEKGQEDVETLFDLEIPTLGRCWFVAWTCGAPGCSCRDARCIAAFSQEEREKAIPLGRASWPDEDSGTAEFLAQLGEGAVAFYVEVDTGMATPIHLGEDADPVPPRLSEVLENLTGDALDTLAKAWLRGKGMPDHEEPIVPPEELRQWKPGEKVAWFEAHQVFRREQFLLDDCCYEAVDYYCVNPHCPCRTILIEFIDMSVASAAGAGTVVVDGDAPAKLHAPRSKAMPLLGKLWRLYVLRNPQYRERLAHRREKMSEYGVRLHALDSERRMAPRGRPWVRTSRKGNSKKHK